MKNFKIFLVLFCFISYAIISGCCKDKQSKEERSLHIKEGFSEFIGKPLQAFTLQFQPYIKDTVINRGMYLANIKFNMEDEKEITVFIDIRGRIESRKIILDSLNTQEKDKLYDSKILEIKLRERKCNSNDNFERENTFEETIFRHDSLGFENDKVWQKFIGKKVGVVMSELIYNWGYIVPTPVSSHHEEAKNEAYRYDGYKFMFSKYSYAEVHVFPDLPLGWWGKGITDNERYDKFVNANVKSIVLICPLFECTSKHFQ